MTVIIMAVLCVGSVGLLIGIFLGVADRYLKVEVDPREEEILNVLPGNNCGGCGYAGCSGLAAAIVKDEAPVNGCPVGGSEIAALVGEIMGVEAAGAVRQVAFVKCAGDCTNAANDYEYMGIEDCNMLSFVPNGGPKTCDYGCLGFGSCVKVCQFDAISILDGIAFVDIEKCKACGQCVDACPKHLIELVPYSKRHKVRCNSMDKGPVTMKGCKVGCIGCSLCVKECPQEAIKVENFIAKIDYSKCNGCGLCAKKCPRGIINKY